VIKENNSEYVFFDSSAWLSFILEKDSKIIEFFEIRKVFTSILSLHEIERKLIKYDFPRKEIKNRIDFILNSSILYQLTKEICINSVKYSVENKLHTIYSLIYASSQETKSPLVTLDLDFRRLNGVILIK